MRKAFISLLSTALALSALTVVGMPAAQSVSAGGPLVLMGIDAEDCGPNGHGPIANYIQLIDSMLADVTNTNTGGILVIGGKAGSCAEEFWNAIGTASGETITYVSGAAAITAQSFAGFEIIAVVGSESDTWQGLTTAENDALVGREGDIANFVNAGGGLIGFDQSGFANPFDYVGALGNFTIAYAGYSDIDPTAAGTAVGVNDALDVCCWHQTFTSYPSFLTVLAFEAGTQNVAALGGEAVIVPPEDCTNGVDDDNDQLVDGADPDCQGGPAPTPETIEGSKYYDANTNGMRDAGEPGIEDWIIDVTNGATTSVATDANGDYSVVVVPGTYDVSEQQAAGWLQTGPSSGSYDDVVVAQNASVSGLDFGNLCVGGTGAHTKGFWQNKNGETTFMAADSGAAALSLLNGLNLKNASGDDASFASYGGFRSWIRKADAKNSAYMLSAQLAALALNELAGLASASDLILAEGAASANAAGFATVDDIIAEANAALADPTPDRDYQLLLSAIIDAANNDRTFVQPGPADCPTPTFPAVSSTLFADGSTTCGGADDTTQPTGTVSFTPSQDAASFSISVTGLEPGISYNVVISEDGDCDPVFFDPAGTEITVDAFGNGSFSGSFAAPDGTYNFLVNVVATSATSDPREREISTVDTNVVVL